MVSLDLLNMALVLMKIEERSFLHRITTLYVLMAFHRLDATLIFTAPLWTYLIVSDHFSAQLKSSVLLER